MLKKFIILSSLVFCHNPMKAHISDLNQLVDTQSQDVTEKNDADNSSFITKKGIKETFKSVIAGYLGFVIGLYSKTCSYDDVKKLPNYGEILNAVATLGIAKYGSKVVEEFVGSSQSNVFKATLAWGYVAGGPRY